MSSTYAVNFAFIAAYTLNTANTSGVATDKPNVFCMSFRTNKEKFGFFLF